MLSRKPDWQSKLQQFLLESVALRFSYGEADCCLFVADAVLAMTGSDIASPYRGMYSSRDEALSLARTETGARSVAAVVASGLERAGLPNIDVSLAQRGDVVLIRRQRDFSLGLISLSGREILALGRQGIVKVPLSRAVSAWHV